MTLFVTTLQPQTQPKTVPSASVSLFVEQIQDSAIKANSFMKVTKVINWNVDNYNWHTLRYYMPVVRGDNHLCSCLISKRLKTRCEHMRPI